MAHFEALFDTWANIEKAKELLDWQPETGFETGMSHTVDWYQQNKDWLSEIVF